MLAALTVVGAMFVGCSISHQTIEMSKLGPANQIVVYDHGSPVSERVIAAGSDEDKAIAAWLQAHADGWQTDYHSYAPARFVRGTNYTLNFHKDRCILNYGTTDGGEWFQVSRPMNEGDTVPNIFTPSH